MGDLIDVVERLIQERDEARRLLEEARAAKDRLRAALNTCEQYRSEQAHAEHLRAEAAEARCAALTDALAAFVTAWDRRSHDRFFEALRDGVDAARALLVYQEG